jgi:hypothetical protein
VGGGGGGVVDAIPTIAKKILYSIHFYFAGRINGLVKRWALSPAGTFINKQKTIAKKI